ncbi:MAG TPA: C45 family peptidase [Thermoplasmata archaeon]|jgi:isopenicillin-N N-acyltransferase-like protein|nr:C45 family peptidase [Thermoplasmata archaeon]
MGRTLPVVDLKGSPREWGLQHGRAARRKVASNVHSYLRRFTEWAKVPIEEVHRRADAYRQGIEDASPAYAAAMAGIAEGSGQDLLDIVAVNVRYEMMYSEFANRGLARKAAGLAAVGGCTSFALLPEFTANGHLLIGQNWDWIPEVEGLVVRATDEAGHTHLGFTEAGIAGTKIGLNDAGLGLVINGLVSNEDRWSSEGRPFHVRCWDVLAARTLAEAERSVTASNRTVSSNFLIAQTGAGVVDVEVAPGARCRLEARDGYLAHANHFLDEKALGIWQPLAEDRPGTFTRYAFIQQRLAAWAAAGREVRVEDLKSLLRDHTNTPNSLCRHPDEAYVPDDRYETVVSAIMDLDAKELHVAAGTPCTTRYRRIALS